MKFIITISYDIVCMEIITDKEYEKYKKVIELLDPENDSYFASLDGWTISVKGFLRNLEFKKITEEEHQLLKTTFGNKKYQGIHFYNKLDNLKDAYQPNNKDVHTYILSYIKPHSGNKYYRLYKQFELKTFEYEQNTHSKNYTNEMFSTNCIDVWCDEYMFDEFTNLKNDYVISINKFHNADELTMFLNKNNINLF